MPWSRKTISSSDHTQVDNQCSNRAGSVELDTLSQCLGESQILITRRCHVTADLITISLPVGADSTQQSGCMLQNLSEPVLHASTHSHSFGSYDLITVVLVAVNVYINSCKL